MRYKYYFNIPLSIDFYNDRNTTFGISPNHTTAMLLENDGFDQHEITGLPKISWKTNIMNEKIRYFNNRKIKEAVKDFYLYVKTPRICNPNILKSPKSILFICKGNICRSPFAEHLAKKVFLERSLSQIQFYSAGLQVSTSLTSPKEVLDAAESFGIKLNSHKSRRITKVIAESCDMIIAMESWQVINLRELFPYLNDNIYLLPLIKNKNKMKLWSYNQNNITDPYGHSVSMYYECFYEIERSIHELLSQIQSIGV